MKIKIVTIVVCLFVALIPLPAWSVEALDVKEIKLSNGLTVWLNADVSQPNVVGAVVVKAGAKDSPNTGIAHYFEHIMFKGTDKIGTIDYRAEKLYLDSISLKYDELAKTADAARRAAIQGEIYVLSVKASKYVIPNEFAQLVSQYGGSALNAGTSYDFTEFHNFFSPQYFEQWAELNSERIINPVFRGFQSELETVYEEKNMYSDNFIMPSIEKIMEVVYAGHPYSYPIIGSSENLKNPKLSEMDAFFKKYYVACNMGLLLSGNFNIDSVIPILESTFGRIPCGVVPERNVAKFTPFNNETVKIKLPIPLVKCAARVYRVPTETDKDANALKLANALLSNSNQTGLLDSLVNEHKVMFATAMYQSLNDGGIFAVLAVPAIPFGSTKKTEAKVQEQLERIKKGEFSDEMLNALKLEAYKNEEMMLENSSSRISKMMMVFSQGMSWEESLKHSAGIENITREDIMAVANKYFNANYLRLEKKKGSYPKDKIAKPDFAPIKAQNQEAHSEYAQALERMTVEQENPRFIDFDHDVETVKISPLVTLYSTKNKINDLFELTFRFKRGTIAEPKMRLVAEYIDVLGTDSLSRQEFGKALQRLGTTISFSTDKENLSIEMIGFDWNLKPSLALLQHFFDNVKADKEGMKELVSGYKISRKAVTKSSETLADAIRKMAMYGDKSGYLAHPSLKEIKKMTGDELIAIFKDALNVECSIIYSGTIDTATLLKEIAGELALDKVVTASSNHDNKLVSPTKPIVYFYDKPDARQTYVSTYQTVAPRDKAKFELWGSYFGGGFSSIMFQEIREMRSYAYSASGSCVTSPYKLSTDDVAYVTTLSTQADKTIQAMTLLDSLFTNMPIKEKNLAISNQELKNDIFNEMPTFRSIGRKIDSYRSHGYTEDPNKELYEQLSGLSMSDIAAFNATQMANRPRVWIVVGNKKQISQEALSKFGEVITLKFDQFYR